MANKKCMIFETLGSTTGLQLQESANNEIRLNGVFGVCGVRNNNNRIYNKANYGKMVEALQSDIQKGSCLGELEHPNSMNIDLNNVSHKIESIEMNEDGTITGTILLLDTIKGRNAKAIVEAGVPLYISSRGAGSVDAQGNVTLQTIKTYDLVGTPGFSQAELTPKLKKGQTLECLYESLDDGYSSYAIINEGDDLLGGGDDDDEKKKKKKDDDSSDDLLGGDDEKKDDEKKDDDSSDDSDDLLGGDDSDKKDDDKDKDDDSSDDLLGDDDDSKDKDSDKDKKEDKKGEEKNSSEKSKESDSKSDNKNKDNNTEPTMKEVMDSIKELKDQIKSLQADLHVANEAKEELENKVNELITKVNEGAVNYDAIQEWVTEQFAPEFKAEVISEASEEITESIKDWTSNDYTEGVQNWITEEFAPVLQGWLTEHYSQEVQNWVTEEFAPMIQDYINEEAMPEFKKYVNEDFANHVEGWIKEEYSPEIQRYLTEEFAPTLDQWLNEEYSSDIKEQIVKECNENVSAFLESKSQSKLDDISKVLEALDNAPTTKDQALQMLKESQAKEKYSNLYVVESMPDQYRPMWAGLSDAQKDAIITESRMFDFRKAGSVDNFWATRNFNIKPITEHVEEKPENRYFNGIAAKMRSLRPF